MPLLQKIYLPLVFVGILIFFSGRAFTQDDTNLVPNGDFEDYTQCPFGNSLIDSALFWMASTEGTPDYFNACADPSVSFPVSVPTNFLGTQEAFNGDGYAGIYCAGFPTNSNGREYLHVELVKPTNIGATYLVEFRYSLADDMRLAADGLQVLFKTSFSSIPHDKVMPGIPQVAHPSGSLISEKEEWQLFSQSFVADSSYTYMNIGNFMDSANTETMDLMNGKWNFAYYYIDAVSVTEQVDTTAEESISFYVPNAFSPNQDGINEIFSPLSEITFQPDAYSLSIYNRWGQKLFDTNDPSKGWDGSANGKIAATGMYFVSIHGQTMDDKTFQFNRAFNLIK